MSYTQQFKKFFLHNYKRAIFKAKLTNDKKALIELQASIWQNWNLTRNEKIKLLKELGIWVIKDEKRFK